MAYVGFDLDETLGRFSVAHYPGLFLQPKEALYQSVLSGLYGSRRIPEPIPYSENLQTKCEKAFQLFVNCLVEKEKAQPRLGLIRPSMIDFIQRLYELKQTGAVKKVLIYSNNGNPALLKLAAKMLESLAGAPGLFCDFIHWYHPSRHMEVSYGRPGMASKSMKVLVSAFRGTGCNSSVEDMLQGEYYFFDDLNPPHQDLLNRDHLTYFQIKPYKYDADPKVIMECFKQAFEGAGLVDDQEYFQYIAPILGGVNNYERILQLMESDNATLTLKRNVPNDSQLRTQFNTAFPRPIRKANFTRSLTALRKLENKLNKGMNLTNQERVNYEKAKTIVTNFETQNPEQMGGKKKFKKTKKHRRHG